MIPDINLLPHVSKHESSSKIAYGIISILTIALLTFIIWQFFVAKSDAIKLTNEQQALQAQKEQIQQEFDALNNADKGSLEQSVAFVERISYPVTPLIDEVRTLLAAHAYLRSYDFAEETITVEIDFETFTDISKYVTLLEQSEYFTNVQLSSVDDFEVKAGTSTTDEIDFNDVPRYSTVIELAIDKIYLATGRTN
ncbi:PilN domain-containing protein [Lysinibacillus piscis]|uniref:Malate synthase n=1 Tax=Lysinibacillus piscis TaxID=2518931 RepID=A0ABQ5NG56_9BACI|nr:PilN domain-containing protein [Lysinibacillus sp. KH24]GLC87260.1 hypothetical protein LYSBPC_03870 [Lysinibacillus sp. KH24]